MTEAADAKLEPEMGWYVILGNKGEFLTCWWNQALDPLPEYGYPRVPIADLLRAVAGPIGVGWELAMAHGLPPFEDKVAWHPDAGWCADELRPVTHWHPETTRMLRDAERYRWIVNLEGDWANRLDDIYAACNWRPTTEQVDALIDAKMERESKPEGGE